mgnify:CR=1 FL=1
MFCGVLLSELFHVDPKYSVESTLPYWDKYGEFIVNDLNKIALI